MINYVWPIIVVVAANTLYNISTKLTPGKVNPFASLSLTYLTATFLALLLFFLTSESKNLLTELPKTNWTAIVLGFAIVALEFGYIYVYRVGWKISTGSLVANISLACVLLLIGVLIYHESISLRQLLGMVLCVLGLLLVTK